MPKVSVIVPVYGVEKYIERCARCLFEQTLDDIEYLFIDDCTPDRSIEVLQQVLDDYPQRKSQVVIHRMEKNSGQAAVRNWGMQNASGEYVIHCDSDDWVDTDMYFSMYDKAKNEDADVVICDYVVSDDDRILETHLGCLSINKEDVIIDLLHQKISWALWNKLFRRKAYWNDLVYPKKNMGEDMSLVIQMMMQCNSIQYINYPFYSYYYNVFSISKQNSPEKLIKNRDSHKNNVDILLGLYDKFAEDRLKEGLLFLKYQVKAPLFPYLRNAKIRRYFNSIYSSLYSEIMMNRNFPFICKLKYTIAILGLYPSQKLLNNLHRDAHI